MLDLKFSSGLGLGLGRAGLGLGLGLVVCGLDYNTDMHASLATGISKPQLIFAHINGPNVNVDIYILV